MMIISVKTHTGLSRIGASITMMGRSVARGMSMAGTKSIAGGAMIGAGNTTVLGNLYFRNLVPIV